MTTQWRNRWYKVYPMEDLFGLAHQRLNPAQRGVWYELRSMAGISVVPGLVCASATQSYPHTYLSTLLNCQISLLESTLKKVIALGLCTEDEEGIRIPGWERYQSEYDRQKPYRNKPIADDPEKFNNQKYGSLVKR